jgi:hypothetical protein
MPRATSNANVIESGDACDEDAIRYVHLARADFPAHLEEVPSWITFGRLPSLMLNVEIGAIEVSAAVSLRFDATALDPCKALRSAA